MHDFEEKNFLKCMVLIVKFFVKSKILNENLFKKSMSLNEHFFVWSDFELNFFRLVRFLIKFFLSGPIWNKIFTTCQIQNQIFKHASGFELNISQHLRV